jgi:hypothetical protein
LKDHDYLFTYRLNITGKKITFSIQEQGSFWYDNSNLKEINDSNLWNNNWYLKSCSCPEICPETLYLKGDENNEHTCSYTFNTVERAHQVYSEILIMLSCAIEYVNDTYLKSNQKESNPILNKIKKLERKFKNKTLSKCTQVALNLP